MKKKRTRIFAMVLAAVVLLACLPMAQAVEPEPTETPPETGQEAPPEETVPETEDLLPTEPEEEEAEPPAEEEPTVLSASDAENAVMLLADTEATMTKGYGLPVSPGYPVTFNGRSLTIHGINPHYLGGNVVFCLDPSSPSEEGAGYSQDTTNTLWMTALTAAQRNAIALAIAYGYPNLDYPIAPGGDKTEIVAEAERIGATQVIIWEIVLGKRSATAPFACSDATLKNSVGSNYPTFHQTYDAISAALAAHKDVPSFANRRQAAAPSYEMIRKSDGSYTLTLTDSNGVLSDYSFTASTSGISFSRSGNTLTVTATAAAASALQSGVLASATGHSLDVDESILLVWAPAKSTLQTCGQLKAAPDPVPAYFRLTAPQNGSLRITKTVDHGTKDGFTFTVKNASGATVGTYTTDSTGVITVSNLPLGNYTVTETSNGKSVSYVIPASQTASVSSGQTADVTFANKLKQVRVTIQKSEPAGLPYADSRSLAGAVFTVYNSGGEVITTMTTDASGKATSSYFACQSGVYIQETKAPPGYQLNTEKIQIPEAAASSCTVQYTTVSKTCVETPISGNVTLTKVDADNPTVKIPGATYTVYRDVNGDGKYTPDTDTGHGIMTDTDGVYTMNGLLYGDYLVKETKSPGPEYQLDTTYYPVQIRTQGATVTVTTEGKNAVYEMPTKGSLQIVKLDRGGQTPLAGAGFRIFRDGTQIAELYTDENGEILVENLYYGTDYSYQEFQAPKGYVVDDTVYPFSITEHGLTVRQLQYNDRREGTLQVKKTDSSGSALQGAVFLLEFSQDGGQSWQPVYSREAGGSVEAGGCTSENLADGTLTTGPDGVVTFTGLRADSEILYRLTEVKAPEGQSLQAEPLYVGTLPVEAEDSGIPDSETLDGVTYGYTLYVHAVDGSQFRLPMTGSNGFRLLSAGLCAFALILTGLLALRNRKEEG